MGIFIDNQSSHTITHVLSELIEEAIKVSIEVEPCPYEIDVNVSIVDEEAIRKINKETRDKDAVTDVLSFPLVSFDKPCDFKSIHLGDDAFDMDTGELYLGDMVICYQRALEQAKTYGHTIEREIGFLTVHSMLHLLGYDHMEKEEEANMLAHQKKILDKLGLKR